MKTITIYKKSTGEILRMFSGSDELISINVKDDESYIEGSCNESHEKVINGLLLELSEDEVSKREILSAWQSLKTSRNLALQTSDWTQVPDAPVDRLAWAEYRQALRDLPANTTDPRNPDWPALPA